MDADECHLVSMDKQFGLPQKHLQSANNSLSGTVNASVNSSLGHRKFKQRERVGGREGRSEARCNIALSLMDLPFYVSFDFTSL